MTGNLHHQAPEEREPVQVMVNRGSISLGHGVFPENQRYSGQLKTWLNEQYPLSGNNTQHTVYNRGSHGADVSTREID